MYTHFTYIHSSFILLSTQFLYWVKKIFISNYPFIWIHTIQLYGYDTSGHLCGLGECFAINYQLGIFNNFLPHYGWNQSSLKLFYLLKAMSPACIGIRVNWGPSAIFVMRQSPSAVHIHYTLFHTSKVVVYCILPLLIKGVNKMPFLHKENTKFCQHIYCTNEWWNFVYELLFCNYIRTSPQSCNYHLTHIMSITALLNSWSSHAKQKYVHLRHLCRHSYDACN